MQHGDGSMINGLKAKSMSQSMLEGGAKTRLFHDAASCAIYVPRGFTITYILQCCVLRLHTCLVRSTPFIADCTREERARQFRPVAVDVDFHLHGDRISLVDSSVRGQIERAIGQRCTLSRHDMHMWKHVFRPRLRVSRAQ